MSVCTTCLQGDLPTDGQHNCPGYGEIQITRHLGYGLIVNTAPARARMALDVLAGHDWGATLQSPDLVNIADQVLYRVTGYDAGSAALLLELVEDWRPVPTAKLSEADEAEIRARWLAVHGNNQTAHPVTELRPTNEDAFEREAAGRTAIIDAATNEGEQQP